MTNDKGQLRTHHWANSLLAIAILLSGVGAIAAGVWLAIQLMVDPDAAIWLNQFLPEPVQIPVRSRQSPQTLAEIEATLTQSGLIPGSPTLLPGSEVQDLLLPVMQRRLGCQSECEYISQLRVYRLVELPKYLSPRESAYYELVSQIPVKGLEESFAIAPLLDAESTESASTRQLPMTALRVENVPELSSVADGVWLQLTGQLNKGDDAIAYGQILYYNPQETHFTPMLNWTSPAGELPVWREVSGGSPVELVVNQTIGLEPQLKIYQIKPRSFIVAPIQLEEISLSTPALSSLAYQKAITLARGGLWTSALKQLEPLADSPDWTEAAQAQLGLIRAHAQLSQAQADKSWASPSQQVLTSIIDGRWQAALQVFAASPQNRREIAAMLKADSGRLWKRVEAAVAANSTLPEVKAWGTLIRGAKDGRAGAIAWLQKQFPKSTNLGFSAEELLADLEVALLTTNTTVSRIVGTAQPLETVNATEWLQPKANYENHSSPNALPALEADRIWYQVRVAAFHNGQRWLRTPFNDAQLARAGNFASLLWQQLGLSIDPQLQITFWTSAAQQETVTATVKAVQFRGGELRLLAMGNPPPKPPIEAVQAKSLTATTGPSPQPLVLTQAALQWLEPQVTTLATLSQENPQWVAELLPALWQELQQAEALDAATPVPSLPAIQASLSWDASQEANSVDAFRSTVGNFLVQLVDLTGDDRAEAVLTLPPETLTTLSSLSGTSKAATNPRTLIFSSRGEIIYSEFSGDRAQSLTAIADLGDGGTAGLIVNGANTYRIQRWSTERQRFE